MNYETITALYDQEQQMAKKMDENEQKEYDYQTQKLDKTLIMYKEKIEIQQDFIQKLEAECIKLSTEKTEKSNNMNDEISELKKQIK